MCCGCDTSFIVSVHIQCQASIYSLSCVVRIHDGAASPEGDADSSRAPGLNSGSQGCVNVHKRCSIVGATVTVHQFFCILHFCHTCSLCRLELLVQFSARGSTQVLLCLFPGVLWLWHFLYSVGPDLVSSLHIYPLLCRAHSWWMWLAKQETLTHSGTWYQLLFPGDREFPPWCFIVGATVTVHQFFCILHFCHTCSVCLVKLLLQFPVRGSTQVLLCLFPGVLWLWHFLYSVGPHPVSSLKYTLFCVAGIHGWCG